MTWDSTKFPLRLLLSPLLSNCRHYYYYCYYYYYYYFRVMAFCRLLTFFKTTWVSWHQKGKPFWILQEQEMMGWQWHQLVHMQTICSSFQTHNHASTSPLSFYRPDAQPTASKHWRQVSNGNAFGVHWGHFQFHYGMAEIRAVPSAIFTVSRQITRHSTFCHNFSCVHQF